MIEKLKKIDVGPCEILMCIYFISLPLTITRNDSGSSFLKLLTIPIAGCSLASLIFYKGKVELNSVHFFMTLYCISAVITLYADGSAESVSFVRGYFETLALMLVFTVKRYSKNEITAFEIAQIVLLIILIVLGFLGADWYGDRNTMTLFGATCDPNYFCGLFFLPITTSLKKMRESKIFLVICTPLVFLGAYMVLTSGSRGGLLGLAATIVSYVFISAKNNKQRVIGMLTTVFIAVVAWNVIIPLLPEQVSSRFSIAELISSKGTGRGDIWVSILEEVKESDKELFIGKGINARHKIMMKGKMEEMVAHNQVIQALYNQGIFGLVIFVFMSAAAIFRNVKKRGYISAAMIGTLALSMTLSINPSIKAFWNLLIYSALSFENAGTDEKGLKISERLNRADKIDKNINEKSDKQKV